MVLTKSPGSGTVGSIAFLRIKAWTKSDAAADSSGEKFKGEGLTNCMGSSARSICMPVTMFIISGSEVIVYHCDKKCTKRPPTGMCGSGTCLEPNGGLDDLDGGVKACLLAVAAELAEAAMVLDKAAVWAETD